MRRVSGTLRIAMTAAIVALALVALTACGSTELSDAFDQEVVEATALDVIELVNAGDTEAIKAMSTDEVANALTDDVMQQVYAIVEQAGAFSEVSKMAVVGSSDKKTGTDYAAVVAEAAYAEKTLTYTITFAPDMKIAGLFVK